MRPFCALEPDHFIALGKYLVENKMFPEAAEAALAPYDWTVVRASVAAKFGAGFTAAQASAAAGVLKDFHLDAMWDIAARSKADHRSGLTRQTECRSKKEMHSL